MRTRPRGAAEAGDRDAALVDLLGFLAGRGYRFVTPTPETHKRVLENREGRAGADLRDAFGWNLPFPGDLLPADLRARLVRSGVLDEIAGRLHSKMRVASVDADLFLHSGFPTLDRDAVFFGPDSYRFVRFLATHLPAPERVNQIVDIGAGNGVGGILIGRALGARITLVDVNPGALRLAAINAGHADVAIETIEGAGLERLTAPFDLAVMNPPFVADPLGRAYRDGGASLGAGLSIAWALDAARRLGRGGRVLLYSGSAIVEGKDRLHEALQADLPDNCRLDYMELDPDIFGELLAEPAYACVERIAAVGAVIDRLD